MSNYRCDYCNHEFAADQKIRCPRCLRSSSVKKLGSNETMQIDEASVRDGGQTAGVAGSSAVIIDEPKIVVGKQDGMRLMDGVSVIAGFIGSIIWTGFVLLLSPFMVVMLRANDRHPGTSWLPYILGVLLFALLPWIAVFFAILSGKNRK